jgi:2-keto-4-pentenoate hydratase/2-oxohepta-3-ene-1,7-dioic acid hydratase in catechol pathway
MRLLTFEDRGVRRLGALVGEQVVDLAAAGAVTAADMRGLLEAGPAAWAELAGDLASRDCAPFARPLAGLKLDAPVRPSKIVAIGQNYFDHVREQNAALPERPIIFAKFPTTIIGAGDEIRWEPALSEQIDWEAELAVVIGRPARRVRAEDAYEYVFGYTVANDVTARDLQRGDGQWVRGKSLDTFCPLGPWIETNLDPSDLRVTTELGGKLKQDGRTSDMVFSVADIVAHVSSFMTLLPGDVVLTGTPEGVGPMQVGDRVSVTVEGIGTLTNQVVPHD